MEDSFPIWIRNSNVYFIIRNCTLFNSTEVGNSAAGISLSNTSNGKIISNNCSFNNGYGIYLQKNSHNNSIDGNDVFNNSWDGINLLGSYSGDDSCQNNTIFNNKVINNSWQGIELAHNCINNTIISNKVRENKGSSGILINYGSENNTIKDNEIVYNYNGIIVWDNSNNTKIYHNHIRNNTGIGIDLDDVNNTKICHNHILNHSSDGIHVSAWSIGRAFLVIENNTIQYNHEDGISLANSINTIVSNNLIGNNSVNGLDMWDCKNNGVYGNIIEDNIWAGIYIDDSEENRFFQNYFKENTEENGWDTCVPRNHWNNSEIGNYWDDYTGEDTDGDGIGEDPHPLVGAGIPKDFKPIADDPFHNGERIEIFDNDPTQDWRWTSMLKAWCSGSGTKKDPYVIKDLKIDAENYHSGIDIFHSKKYFKIENCTCTNADWAGITLWNATRGLIVGNNCSENAGSGISLRWNSSYNVIKDNILNNNYCGIYSNFNNPLENKNNTIIDNEILGNKNDGIILYDPCYNYTIARNIIHSNQENFGIFLTEHVRNCTIYENIIDNASIGIEVKGNGSLIYNNTFKSDNERCARDLGKYNRWNRGTLGNYWFDYLWWDADDNRIGDIAYPIIFGTYISYDYYPIWEDGMDNPPNAPTNPSPAHEETGIGIPPTLSVEVFDPDGDPMSVSFYNGSDNSLIDTISDVYSGSKAELEWSGLTYSTNYTWYVIAVDNATLSTGSSIWGFTTKAAPQTPPSEDDGGTLELETLDVDIKVNISSITEGQSINFTAIVNNGTEPFIYNWDFDDDTISNESIVIHQFNLEGTFNVSLIVYDANNATGKVNKIITVSALIDDTDTGNGIPGYNSFLIFGLIGIASTVLAIKIFKKTKQ